MRSSTTKQVSDAGTQIRRTHVCFMVQFVNDACFARIFDLVVCSYRFVQLGRGKYDNKENVRRESERENVRLTLEACVCGVCDRKT